MRYVFILLGIIPAGILLACVQKNNGKANTMSNENDIHSTASNGSSETATFGNGCFWCTEAVFQQLKGVSKVISGYSGGHVENPTYEEVCTKTTGHAEAIQVVFNPSVITYDELLEVFWQTHDPTTLNRQGNDIGPQYRSVIFYHNAEQKEKAEKYKAELDKSGAFTNPIVTAIEPFKNFYAAEDYHQNYYKLNGKAPYCYFVIKPKLEKFEKVFKNKLKAH
ncbi:MAG: peptide-methionine (S)-S-oxide reductase MsrA [Chitinophagaceae bacterium]|nr:peptide-methionine (S)-S-oxide reductase MsrA [Chitinophagaceae bacterium]